VKYGDFDKFKDEIRVNLESTLDTFISEKFRTKYREKAVLLTPDEIKILGHELSKIEPEFYTNLITENVGLAKGDSRVQASS